MDKTYLEEQYKIAVSDFKCSRTEEEQWNARKELAKLEQLAGQIYGFAYADKLHSLLNLHK